MTSTLAILAGGGTLPGLLASAGLGRGWTTHVITFEGQPQPRELPNGLASVATFNIAGVGAIITHLKANKVTHVALGGNLNKPNLFRLRPDAKGLALLGRVRGFSDDALLRAVSSLLEDEGLTVLPTPELLPQLQAVKGVWGKTQPGEGDKTDIALGFDVLRAMGDLDIGQAVIVHKGAVLGVEAVEGTDNLIARCAALRGNLGKHEKAGWLIKAAKPNQTDMADLPTIGPATVELLALHGYRGLAVQSGRTLVLDAPRVIEAADAAGLVVIGGE